MQHIHASVAYIACRLITGRRIAMLYDLATEQEIPIASLPDERFLREFDERHKDYVPGYASDCTYEYEPSDGPVVEIFINDRTFIVHVRGSNAYFIGNIQRDTVYLYDHKEAAHFRYRVTVYAEDPETGGKAKGPSGTRARRR